MAPPPLPDRTETLAPREPAGEPPARSAPRPPVEGSDDPERYEQIGEHARGGLGRIVRAIDKRLGRTVAVKELLRHSESNEARFMREALITARLEHPGIVPVHEAGRWPNGDPYYVMKLVEGRTLKELIAERTTMRDRLALLPHVIAVADAVGYAHSEGVIHRDVKPSNIMVGAFGETIVVDWGLARDCRRDVPPIDPRAEDGEYLSSSGSASTVSGKVVGTPAYMAPEQARGEVVDARADVYAIGAVLYELLAGSPAHQDTTPRATLERVLAGPPRPLVAAVPAVPGELGAIVAKAMAREPAERYPNATALAEDLRRYHTGKLVSAHSYSSWALIRKKLAQHRGVVAVAVASAVALGVVGVESFRRVVHERNIARSERGRTEDALSQADKRRRELVLLQAVTSLRKDPTASLAWLKTYELESSDRAQVVNVIDEAIALGVARHVFRTGDRVNDAVFTADGKTMIASVHEGELRAYDLATGRSRRLGVGTSPAEVIVLTPDGTRAITGGTLGEVISWPLGGGEPTPLLPGTGRVVMALRFSPDGRKLLVEREKGVHDVVLLGVDGSDPTDVGPKGALRTAVACDDWTKIAVSLTPNSISAYEAGELRPIGTTDKAIEHLAVSPDGALALAHDGATVWAVPFRGGPMKPLASYREKLIGFEWSPDRKTLALVGHSHDIVLVDMASGTSRELRGHTDALYMVQWTRDSKRLLSASDDATARVWNIAEGTAEVLRGHDDDVYRARFSPDETQVVTASVDGSTRVWDVRSQSAKTWYEGDDIVRLRLDGDDAIVRTPTTVARWNVLTGARQALFAWGGEKKTLGSGYPSRSGELLAMPRADWSLELRRRGGPSLLLVGHAGAITSLGWTRDDKYLYTASLDGTLRRWDTATGVATTLIQGAAAVRGVAVAADGSVAVQVGDEARMIERDGTMRVLGTGGKWCIAYAEFEDVGDRLVLNRCDMSFAVVNGDRVVELASSYVNRYAVSKDGTLLAGGMGDRTVIVWDLRTGKEVVLLRGHTDLVMDVAFSPDGKQLASASYDRTIRVWNLDTKQHRVLRGHDSAVDQVAWRDASHLVTGSRDGTIRVWDVPPMAVPSAAELSARMARATSTQIDVQNRPTTIDGASGSS